MERRSNTPLQKEPWQNLEVSTRQPQSSATDKSQRRSTFNCSQEPQTNLQVSPLNRHALKHRSTACPHELERIPRPLTLELDRGDRCFREAGSKQFECAREAPAETEEQFSVSNVRASLGSPIMRFLDCLKSSRPAFISFGCTPSSPTTTPLRDVCRRSGH